MIRLVHSALFDSIDSGIDIASATVEISSVDVDDQRFARYMLGKDSRGVGQPIVGVDNIEIKAISKHRRHCLVVANLFDEIIGIAPGEAHATEVVGTYSAIVVSYAITEPEILFGGHSALHTLPHIVVTIFFPHDRYTVRSDDAQEGLVFVAPWFRDDESDVHIGLLCHTARQSVTGGT